MKNILIIFTLLMTLCCYTIPAKAQKAYEILNYIAIIDGHQATLQLADGYLLASKVTIRYKLGGQVFSPSLNELDAQGDLRFDAITEAKKYKDKMGSWIILKNLDEPHNSAQIKAVYWNGQVQKVIVFK
jgi:hypothetical protein